MDHCRKACVLSAVAVAGAMMLMGVALARPPLLALRASRWLAPAALENATAFEPTECLRSTQNPATQRQISIGRAAFRSSLLLGGQAARSGLSCNSCHRNGRDNPDFQFPGLSGRPGTADVTSSLMSSHRGDGVANPVPIPDLSSGLPTISRAEGNPALRNFVRGLIVEEFDGAEPSALTLDAVTTYVRMLDRQACPADGQQPSRVEMYVAHVRQAVRAALFALDAGDETLARLMLGSARGELGAIDERYGGAELSSERENIRAADLELGAIQEALDRSLRDVGVRITVWLANTPSWAEPVARKESQSLFNPRSRRLRR